jgi:2-C-methyl-D-erythritol 4-phosphate cytidylyltransferase
VTRGEVSALILAAGSGTRLGQSKAFLECAGRTLLERAVERAAMFADEVVVGLSAEDLGRVPPSVRSRPVVLLAGGETRHATVEALLARATRPLVLLHEVARPLAPPPLFAAVLEAARDFDAAAPCVLAPAFATGVTGVALAAGAEGLNTAGLA